MQAHEPQEQILLHVSRARLLRHLDAALTEYSRRLLLARDTDQEEGVRAEMNDCHQLALTLRDQIHEPVREGHLPDIGPELSRSEQLGQTSEARQAAPRG